MNLQIIAAKILPIVKNQHLLLCTLLIWNDLTMEVINAPRLKVDTRDDIVVSKLDSIFFAGTSDICRFASPGVGGDSDLTHSHTCIW